MRVNLTEEAIEEPKPLESTRKSRTQILFSSSVSTGSGGHNCRTSTPAQFCNSTSLCVVANTHAAHPSAHRCRLHLCCKHFAFSDSTSDSVHANAVDQIQNDDLQKDHQTIGRKCTYCCAAKQHTITQLLQAKPCLLSLSPTFDRCEQQDRQHV